MPVGWGSSQGSVFTDLVQDWVHVTDSERQLEHLVFRVAALFHRRRLRLQPSPAPCLPQHGGLALGGVGPQPPSTLLKPTCLGKPPWTLSLLLAPRPCHWPPCSSWA